MTAILIDERHEKGAKEYLGKILFALAWQVICQFVLFLGGFFSHKKVSTYTYVQKIQNDFILNRSSYK